MTSRGACPATSTVTLEGRLPGAPLPLAAVSSRAGSGRVCKTEMIWPVQRRQLSLTPVPIMRRNRGPNPHDQANSKRRKRSTARKSSRSGMGRWYWRQQYRRRDCAYEHRAGIRNLPGHRKLTALLSHAEKPSEKKAQATMRAEKKPPKRWNWRPFRSLSVRKSDRSIARRPH